MQLFNNLQQMSLAQLYKNYQSKKKISERVSQTIKKQIERCIEDQTISALKLQNYKVNNIHKKQQLIENKFKKQNQLLSQFRNNQELWKNMYEHLNRALMEAGDLVHYSGYVEAEISQLLGEGTVAKYLQETEKEDGAQEAQIKLNQTSPRKQKQQVKAEGERKQGGSVRLAEEGKVYQDQQQIA